MGGPTPTTGKTVPGISSTTAALEMLCPMPEDSSLEGLFSVLRDLVVEGQVGHPVDCKCAATPLNATYLRFLGSGLELPYDPSREFVKSNSEELAFVTHALYNPLQTSQT